MAHMTEIEMALYDALHALVRRASCELGIGAEYTPETPMVRALLRAEGVISSVQARLPIVPHITDRDRESNPILAQFSSPTEYEPVDEPQWRLLDENETTRPG